MNKKLLIFCFFIIAFIPGIVSAITLVRVGYIDLDKIIDTYTEKYLDAEIKLRESYTEQLQNKYNTQYFILNPEERQNIQTEIKDHYEVLNMLRYNQIFWDSSQNIKDDILYQIIQRDIMAAIKKTSELEGFNLVLDNTGNFIYGSEEINLTDKVLFRLDEKLLEIQNSQPLVPISLELEFETLPQKLTETTD